MTRRERDATKKDKPQQILGAIPANENAFDVNSLQFVLTLVDRDYEQVI